MFGREEAARMAATRAIIDLIISEKQSPSIDSESFPSSSQASCSQQTKLPGPVGLNLFQELKGLLRRCLSQQVCTQHYP
jgi:Fanconi anemia group I protein